MNSPGYEHVTPLDYAVLAAYFLGTMGIGFHFYRRTRSREGFTAAHRSLPGWACGLSILATYVSSISFLALPGKAFAANWNPFVFSLSLPVVTWIAVRFVLPYYRRGGEVSAYSHLERRFGTWARLYASGFYLLTQLARIGTVTYLMALPMHVLVGWDIRWVIVFTGLSVTLYSFVGGIVAVIWTDALQAVVLTAGALACLGVALLGLPEGPGQVFAIASAHDKFSLGSFGPGLAEPTFWVVLVYGIVINLQNFCIDQNYIQRYIASRSEGEARKSVWLGGLLYVPLSALFFLIGTALFAFYTARPERLPEELRLPEKADSVLPYFIGAELPPGVTGLVVAAIFAAAMSTVSTSLNSSATVLMSDFYERLFNRGAPGRSSLPVLYAGTIAWGALGTLIALALVGAESALDAWWLLAGIFGGGMLGLFLLGFLSRRATSAPAAAGVVAGVLVTLWLGLSPAWTGALARYRSPFHGFLTIVIGTLTILAVGWAASWLSVSRSRIALGAVLVAILAFLASPGSTGGEGMPKDPAFENSLGMRFVRIEAGSFSMGNDRELPADLLGATEHRGRPIWLPARGDHDERPVHRVTIRRPFYLGVTEVTNEQYERFDPRHMLLRGRTGFSIDGDEAVVHVTWREARAFCDWLSRKEGRPYRLPTEAEWEYAARAGSEGPFAFGDALPEGILKNPDNSWYPEPTSGRGRQEVVPLTAGRTPPSAWGLRDMHGNVEEWCDDWYGPYDAADQVDPVGPRAGDFKVTRGGSHGTVAFYLRSANRMGTLPEDRHWLIGFRVALGERPRTTPRPPPPPPRNQRGVRPARPAGLDRGPEPGRPYFEGPRPYVKIPEGSEGPLFSRHNHAPGLVECPNGDLLAVWYTTVTERGREVAVAASRLRAGETEWEAASPFWDPPDRNDSALALWSDGRRLYHFNSLSVAATWGPLAIVLRTSDDSGASWSKARLIVAEHHGRHQVVPSVLRTREGVLVLPADATPAGDGGTALHLSRDGGETWEDAGGTIAGIHAGVTQLSDGRLFALGRGDTIRGRVAAPQDERRRIDSGGAIDGRMPQSHSADLGRSWTHAPSPFPPIGGGQRVQLLRLREGPLLLLSFANAEDPVAVETTDATGERRRITGLFAALSYDDGRTWPRIRVVGDDPEPPRPVPTTDARATFLLGRTSGEPRGYLAATQAASGVVHLISSWNHYAFNLKWLETPPP